jgi:TonB-linked SusC/RagA family outer membrane protein
MQQFFRIMRLTSFFLLVLVLQVSAKGYGQITLQAKQTPLTTVLEQIRQQTNYVFLTNQMELGKYKVTADLKNVDIVTALDKIFNGYPLQYKIIDRTVVIKQKLAITAAAAAEANTPADIEVSGRIVDEKGVALEGCSVWATKGSFLVGTSSDKNGNFTLKNIPDDATLHISRTGYMATDVNLKKAILPLAVTLKPNVQKLEEVNVTFKTGYQQISKDRATGSFVQIDKETLERTPSTNILDRIAYVTSGLVFDRKSSVGAIGERQTPYLIRGLSTINGNPHPLIVIDGFPYEETTIDGSNLYLILNDLNPNDVADVTILRDAAAASIWGAKAGNGVIVITTKKGRFNQPVRIEFTSNISIKDKEDLSYLNMMSSKDAVEAHTLLYGRGAYNAYDATYPASRNFPVLPEAAEILLKLKKGAITQAEADAQLARLSSLDTRDDVSKYLMQKGLDQQYALNLSGGSDKFSYYTSIGYDRNRGTSIGNDNNRLTLRSDNTYKATKNLTINAYLNYSQATIHTNGFDYMGLLTGAPLYTKLADDAGNALAIPYKFRQAFADTVGYPALNDWRYYPLLEDNNKNYTGTSMDIRAGGGLQYTLPAGFRLDVNYQYQRIVHETKNINGENSFYSRDLVNRFMTGTPTSLTYPIQRGAVVFYNNNIEKFWQARAQLNYNRHFGEQHEVTALAGMDVSERVVDGMSDYWYGYNEETGVFQTFINYDTYFPTRPQNSSERIPNGNNIFSNLRRQRSYFGNAAYTYDNRYTISVSGRQDGANIFGVKTNQQLSPFWSAGALWNIAHEKFYKLRILPELKLRATYGFNGNYKNASAFSTISYYNSASTGFPAAQLTGFPNPYLRWEKTRVFNLGLDFGFIGNRISGSLEFYQKDGVDLIGTVANDPTSGIANYSGNKANIRGRGVDISLNSQNLKGAFQWNTSLQFSYNTNKVTSFEGKYITGQLLGGGTPVIGRSLWGLYSYKWAGLDPLTGLPQGILADTVTSYKKVVGYTGPNPNTQPTDLEYNGSSTPLYSGNMLNTFMYKGINLSFNITFSFAYYFRRNSVNYNALYPVTNSGGTYAQSITHKDYAIRWKKPGDELITNVPAMPAGADSDLNSFYSYSSVLVEKGDNIRLRDIRLGYDFSGLRINKFVKRTSLYATVTNLGMLWKANKQGLDPDYYSREIPAAKTYVIGLQVSL